MPDAAQTRGSYELIDRLRDAFPMWKLTVRLAAGALISAS
jgi:hypothetical protein